MIARYDPDFSVEAANDGLSVLLIWTKEGPAPRSEISVQGRKHRVTTPLLHPGVYSVPDLKLLYEVSRDCKPNMCVMGYADFFAEWQDATWPPGLKLYHKGKLTGTIPGEDIIRNHQDQRCFIGSTVEQPWSYEFTPEGKLTITTMPRGPLVMGFPLPGTYSETVEIDIVEGRITRFESHDPVMTGLFLLLTTVVVFLGWTAWRRSRRRREAARNHSAPRNADFPV